jgi:hypothetical protein
MKRDDCKVGDHVWYLGDLEVIITKVCKVQVKITDANDGYYFVNKLVDPSYLKPHECELVMLTQMANCQKEKTHRAKVRKLRSNHA